MEHVLISMPGRVFDAWNGENSDISSFVERSKTERIFGIRRSVFHFHDSSFGIFKTEMTRLPRFDYLIIRASNQNQMSQFRESFLERWSHCMFVVQVG